MRITHLPITSWYETEAGRKLYITQKEMEQGYYAPNGADYCVRRFPCEVVTTYLSLNPDGTSKECCSTTSTFPEDLVLKMTNSGHYTLGQSMIIASEACERCLNVLGHNYELDWGYPEYGPEWHKANTECEYCKHEFSNIVRSLKREFSWWWRKTFKRLRHVR